MNNYVVEREPSRQWNENTTHIMGGNIWKLYIWWGALL